MIACGPSAGPAARPVPPDRSVLPCLLQPLDHVGDRRATLQQQVGVTRHLPLCPHQFVGYLGQGAGLGEQLVLGFRLGTGGEFFGQSTQQEQVLAVLDGSGPHNVTSRWALSAACWIRRQVRDAVRMSAVRIGGSTGRPSIWRMNGSR